MVAGVGYVQVPVATLTEDGLAALLQPLVFPRGMTYNGTGDPRQVVTESDYAQTGCGALGTSDCAPSVWVKKVGEAQPDT